MRRGPVLRAHEPGPSEAQRKLDVLYDLVLLFEQLAKGSGKLHGVEYEPVGLVIGKISSREDLLREFFSQAGVFEGGVVPILVEDAEPLPFPVFRRYNGRIPLLERKEREDDVDLVREGGEMARGLEKEGDA